MPSSPFFPTSLPKNKSHRNGYPDERLIQLIKNSFDILVLLDKEGKQQFVSESCERILGYKPEELIGISVIEEMIHPEDQEKTRQGLLNILKHSTNGGTQYRHRHKNGGWVYLEAFGTNQLSNPLIESIVLNVRDISERKAVEEALRESEQRLSEMNAAKDILFSIIGHDLRNPFTSIIGLSDLLFHQVQEGNLKGIEEAAQIIRDSSLRINDLLTHLLMWAKAQSGRFELSPEVIDLSTLIDESVQLFQDSARQKSVALTALIPDHITINADRQMILTVLRNLLSNGIKFTPKDGSVTIRATSRKNRVIVSIKDTGIGLDKDQLDGLFHIDHAHSQAGTQGERGTGLGLLLCSEFINLHKGKIWADSTPGKGSVFSFSLPQ